jgi:hypothetical protein
MDFAGGEDFEFGVLAGDEIDALPPPPAPQPRVDAPDWQRALAAVTLKSELQIAAASTGAHLTYVLTAPPRGTVTEVTLHFERAEPRADGTWSAPRRVDFVADAAHLPDADDRWATALVRGTAPIYGNVLLNGPLLDVLLPRLCPTGRVRLRQAHRNVPAITAEGESPLMWDAAGVWQFVLTVVFEPPSAAESLGSYRVDAVLVRDDVRVGVHRFALLTDSIAVVDGVAARFDPAGGFAWAVQLRARGALRIPVESRRALVESLARSAVEHVEVPDDLRWDERVVAPRFRVTIGRPVEGPAGPCPGAGPRG